ncbi:glycosyl transferase family 4-domain-containing protein [Myxozyma melibiosi]|uniref:UDP-N-acetylglucosamine--dolichyl-phosphate N-acetylglucosaminephosphotransferase n=1 Tax=Myxozyma melibiosi TaxID=54550 RepID=A0ABR1FF06_9ASCO
MSNAIPAAAKDQPDASSSSGSKSAVDLPAGTITVKSTFVSRLVSLLAIGLALSLIFNSQEDASLYDPLKACVGFSILAYLITVNLIPILAPEFVRVGFFGKDLGKKDRPVIAETMGAVCAVVYLVSMFFFIPFLFYKYYVTSTSGGGNREQGYDAAVELLHKGRALRMFPHSKLAEYLAALLSLFSMLVLGVADDLFDIRWRNKLFMPAIAALPMMFVYYVDFGVTRVVVPEFAYKVFFPESLAYPTTIDLGALYYVYMLSLAIFLPNSINILAGVNGLEAGQAFVIAIFLLLNDALYILPSRLFGLPEHPGTEAHLFSTYFTLPLVAVTLALLRFNWFPARVFVGDTYCYFAGMVLAQVGIVGHFAKTLMLFLVPQVFNFLYSAPQLFHLVDCPRHRLPKLNTETGLLEPSRVYFPTKPRKLQTLLLRTMSIFKLIHLEYDSKTGAIASASNMTLINLILTWTGPLREDRLALVLLLIQGFTCMVGLTARHTIAPIIFGRDNI